MSQTIIRNKLIKHLEIQGAALELKIKHEFAEPLAGKKIRELKAYYEKLIALLKEGQCFGLALTEAAYSTINKGPWWHHILYLIANWDENDVNALNHVIDLNPLLPSSDFTAPKTLAEYFDLAISLILTQQASHEEDDAPFSLKGANQLNFLDPHHQFFSLVVDDQIKYVADRKKLYIDSKINAVNFFDLEKSQIEGNICLIHSDYHTINVKCINGKWHLYDSENSHLSLNTMNKVFSDSKTLVTEIFNLLNTSSFCVEVATLNPNQKLDFSAHESILTVNEAIVAIQQSGIHIMARHTPEKLAKVVDLLCSKPESLAALTKALLNTNHEGISGFRKMVRYAPAAFEKLLSIAECHNEIRIAVLLALKQTNHIHWTGLYALIMNAPSQFEKVMALANKDTLSRQTFLEALFHPNENGKNGLHALAFYSPASFHSLFDSVERDKNLCSKLATALMQVDKEGWTALQTIAYFTPETLLPLFQLAKKHDAIYQSLLKILYLPNKNNVTSLDIMLQSSVPAVREIAAKLNHDAEALIMIETIIYAENYWKEKTNSYLTKYPAPVQSLQKLWKTHPANEKLNKCIDFSTASTKTKKKFPFLHSFSVAQNKEAEKLFGVLSDLSDNRNNAFDRLKNFYQDVLHNQSASPVLACA